MLGRVMAGVVLLAAVGIAVSRALCEPGPPPGGRPVDQIRTPSDVLADDDIDLCKYNTPRVGWVVGEVVGAETPGLAPTPRELHDRLRRNYGGAH